MGERTLVAGRCEACNGDELDHDEWTGACLFVWVYRDRERILLRRGGLVGELDRSEGGYGRRYHVGRSDHGPY